MPWLSRLKNTLHPKQVDVVQATILRPIDSRPRSSPMRQRGAGVVEGNSPKLTHGAELRATMSWLARLKDMLHPKQVDVVQAAILEPIGNRPRSSPMRRRGGRAAISID